MSNTGVISFPRTQTHGRTLSHPNRLPSRVAPLLAGAGLLTLLIDDCSAEVVRVIRCGGEVPRPDALIDAEYRHVAADVWTTDFTPILQFERDHHEASIDGCIEYTFDVDDCVVVLAGMSAAARRFVITLRPDSALDPKLLVLWNDTTLEEIDEEGPGGVESWSGPPRAGRWSARVSSARHSATQGGGKIRLTDPMNLDYHVSFAVTRTDAIEAREPLLLVLRSPSPAPELRLNLPNGARAFVRLVSVDGREVDSREWRGGQDHAWTLAGLSTGIYFTRVTSEGRELARGRLVVTR